MKFKYYECKLDNKEYKIFIPLKVPKDFWLYQMTLDKWFWIDYLDSGGKPIRMPINDVKELICDWIAAGKTYMGKDFTFSKETKYVANRLVSAKIDSDTAMYIISVFTQLMLSDDPETKFKEIVESNVNYRTR